MTQELLRVFLAQKTIFILLFNTVAENFFKGEELANLPVRYHHLYAQTSFSLTSALETQVPNFMLLF